MPKLNTLILREVERVKFLFHCLLLQLMTSEESFYKVGIHSTVEKRSIRMPDTTVKTTKVVHRSEQV